MTRASCPENGCDEVVTEANLFDHLRIDHDRTYDESHDIADEHTTFFTGPPVEEFDEDFLLSVYRRMRTIREVEATLEELDPTGEIPGNVHLSMGQEGVAVGTCHGLTDDDWVGSTHRGHGHAIAKGADPTAVIAEIGAKETGTNGGRGGTLHLIDLECGFLGQNAIVGASPVHMTGAALTKQIEGDNDVGVAFLGDGAMNQGVLLEAMNIASIWDLPIVFVCENNQYAVSFSWRDSTANDHLPDRAAGCGVPGQTIDGQNVLAVYDTVQSAVEKARNGEGPQFVECRTYRYAGHFAAEKAIFGDLDYRDEGEMEYWRRRDPLTVFTGQLRDAGVATGDELPAIDEEVADLVDDAVEFMREGDYPPADEALEDVYTDQDYPNFPARGYR